MFTVRRCGIDMCRAKKCCPSLVAFLYTFGLSHKSICEVTGYNSATVGNIISKKFGSRKERGYVVRAKCGLASIGSDALDVIEQEYLAGASTYELGKKYGVHHGTIGKWMRKRGHCRGKGGNSSKGGKACAELARLRYVQRFESVADKVEYLSGGHGSTTVRCKTCGREFWWDSKRMWAMDVPCPRCRGVDNESRHLAKLQRKYEREQQLEAAREWRLSVPRICKECGEPFYSEHNDAAYCCDTCRRKAKQRSKAKQPSAGGYRKRLRIVRTKATYDPSVTLNAVYKRFKGKCCACGCKVYRSQEYRPDQATLDHIIALANNGTHTWDNVQLLCSDCNSRKRDLGQMRLPIAI